MPAIPSTVTCCGILPHLNDGAFCIHLKVLQNPIHCLQMDDKVLQSPPIFHLQSIPKPCFMILKYMSPIQGWHSESTEAPKFELGLLDTHGTDACLASSIFWGYLPPFLGLTGSGTNLLQKQHLLSNGLSTFDAS